jgi:uncharacterized protein YbjT (DUF2867 family)
MIVVTTPTGQIGRHVIQDLVDAGETVRVIVRDPAKLESAVRDRVDVVEGSHRDPATIDRALDGADALFWLVPPTPVATMEGTYSGFTRPAAEAITRRGTAHVVVVTALGRGTEWEDRAGLVTASIRMVDLLNGTGAAVRGLAMPGFMENALQQLDRLRQGRMLGPIDPDRKLPHTATRDMGIAAARLLTDRSWAGQEDVAVLGPEDLSFNDIAAILSEVLGREVRYQQVPFDAFKAQFLERGMPEDFAQGYVDMMRAKNEGMDNAVPRTPANTGPTSFRQWAEKVLKPAVAG